MKKTILVIITVILISCGLFACSPAKEIIIEVPTPFEVIREVEVPVTVEVPILADNEEYWEYLIATLETEDDYEQLLDELSSRSDVLTEQLAAIIKARQDAELDDLRSNYHKVNFVKYGNTILQSVEYSEHFYMKLKLTAWDANGIRVDDNNNIIGGMEPIWYQDLRLGVLGTLFNNEDIVAFISELSYESDTIPNLGPLAQGEYVFYPYVKNSPRDHRYASWRVEVLQKTIQHAEYYYVKEISDTKIKILYPNGNIIDVTSTGFEISYVA